MRSIVCNPSQAECNRNVDVNVILLKKGMYTILRRNTSAVMPYSSADYIRLTAITYQSFGLDKKRPVLLNESFFGEDEWARTTDPLHVKQVL